MNESSDNPIKTQVIDICSLKKPYKILLIADPPIDAIPKKPIIDPFASSGILFIILALKIEFAMTILEE